MENIKSKLVLTAKLYPPPTPQDVCWNVTTQTGLEVILRPGEKEFNYSAEIIEKQADHIYTFILTIDNLTDENFPQNASISIKSLDRIKVETFYLMSEVGQTIKISWADDLLLP